MGVPALPTIFRLSQNSPLALTARLQMVLFVVMPWQKSCACSWIVAVAMALGAWFAAVEASGASSEKHFQTKIAPLLSQHCVECHGKEKRKGRLDLAEEKGALAGGKNGKAIVPGKPEESLLWTKVEANEMPEERPPLSAQEKKLLKEWIAGGAEWPDGFTVEEQKRETVAVNTWVRRLTVPEYIETVRSAVGVDIEKEARQFLPRDIRADGFHNTAYNLNIDLAHVEAYAKLAEIIVGRMKMGAFLREHSECADLKCMPELIAAVGKWIFRGPLDKREVDAFLRLARAAEKQGANFREATRSVLEAMLQSPRFIYRMEKEIAPGKARDPYELASRLSYTIWGASPDKELMRAADGGELRDAVAYERQVKRMLKDPRAIARSLRFAQEWLDLDRLNNLRPNAKRFPKWDSHLAGDMREETLAFFKEVVWKEKRPMWDLMNAKVTFASPRLMAHYRFGSKVSPELPALAAVKEDKSLVALYAFEEGSGDTVRDVSGAESPMNLKIADASAVEWKGARLTMKEPTVISSETPPKRLIAALKKSHAITVEAWITPASKDQKGPARIVTLSSGPSERNFTLGQQENHFDVRLRTTSTDANGMPSLSTTGGEARAQLTHVAFTRDAAGRVKVYVNGEQRGAQDVGGDFSNWDGKHVFALANETTKDRPWRGTFHRLAIYSRALSPQEIVQRGQGLARYDLAKVPGRGGLLTHGSVLTIGGDDASMVTRGLFVLNDILWGTVDDPPPCVDTTPVPTKPGLTQRAIAEARLKNASCAGCHSKFEPFAFGLERFDGVGAYHSKDEHGNPLRDDGSIIIPETEAAVGYKNSGELMDLLAASDRVQRGMTRKLTQFAIGRPLTSTDAPVVDKIHEAALKKRGTYPALMTAIVMSELVRTPIEEKE